MLKLSIIFILLFVNACDDNDGAYVDQENESWVFVANEGEMGSSNGSISMIDESNNVFESDILGDVINSIEVYNDQLIILVNNEQKILLFDIDADGIHNEVEVLLGLSPREIQIIDDMAYITAWNPDFNVFPYTSGYVKVLNLITLEFKEDIEVGTMPEGILYDSEYLWVANSGDDTVSKVDIVSNLVVETVQVGNGPQNLASLNNELYISRTFYDYDLDENGYWINVSTIHGSSKKIGSEVITVNYGNGVACGGAILKHNNKIYRSYNGGVSPLDENLNIDNFGKIGNYNQNEVYHVEIINNHLWFGLRDITGDEGYIKVVDFTGEEIFEFSAGINPGDFTFWHK